MTDVTEGRDVDGAELSAADEQLLRELTERARAGGLKLTGEGGLLGKLTKMVVEGALEGEMDDHLGYGRHDPAGRDGGNYYNSEVLSSRRGCVIWAAWRASVGACLLSWMTRGPLPGTGMPRGRSRSMRCSCGSLAASRM